VTKDTAAAAARQILPDNPTVIIRYTPEDAPLALGVDVEKMIARVNSIKEVKNPKQLEVLSEVLNDAQITSQQLETFLESLRLGIQRACERVREIPRYETFEATLTIRRLDPRKFLNDGVTKLRGMRANYLMAVDAENRRKQAAIQAEQDRINKKNADDAAKAAKKAGADAGTVEDIRRDVMSTPAPIIESKAQEVADSLGAGLRYDYSADCKDLRKWLQYCLENPVLFATLATATPDIEKAFRSTARSQKEAFNYPGMTFKKTPIDVSTKKPVDVARR
jgi:hypothetical protein